LARAGRSVCITSPSRLRSRLAALPLSVLRWPEELLSRLDSMGAGCIGDLQRLPRAGLARRIGAERVRELDRLVTPGMDPRPPVAPPVQFSRRVDLDFETFDSGRVLSALRPVLEQLEGFLRARQRGITALRVALVHRSGPPTCCMVRCVAPEYGASRLAALLAARMECLLLAQPVRSAWLVAGRLRGFSLGSGTLWQPGEHGGQAAERMPEFLQALQARLGEQAVYGVSCVVGHRPEYQWHRTVPGLAAPEVVQPEPPRACQWPPAARPLGLLEPPVALTAERDGRGHVCALWHEGSRLELMSGPERIESGWWDGVDIARDYYTARTPVGALLWVFRERHGMRRWFLHGCFA
jgi:protein ImuB